MELEGSKMSSPKHTVDGGETSARPLTEEQQEERNEQVSATRSTPSNLEPKTGDHCVMESRIPEESATASTSSYHTSTEDSNAQHESYTPTATKRQRMSTGCPSRVEINEKAQQLIDEINNKRKEDTVLLADFKKAMEMQVARSYSMLEQSMYQVYEHNGKVMQAKLQELFATLDRIGKLETELQQFRNALGALYTDVQEPPS